jgi:fatty-acyl-CoA synthase
VPKPNDISFSYRTIKNIRLTNVFQSPIREIRVVIFFLIHTAKEGSNLNSFHEPTASYSKGPDSTELLNICIGQALDRASERFPDGLALVMRHTGERFTWRQLRQEVEKLSRGLMGLGVEKGQRVGMWATNCTEWVLAQFATAKIGAILVNLNPRYRAHELEYALRQSECQTLLLISGFRDCDYVETLFSVAPESRTNPPGDFSSQRLPHLKNVVFCGEPAPAAMLSWKQLLATGEQVSTEQLRAREATLSPRDAINIQYTSGTTGFPKGATLTHFNVVNNGMLIGDCMKLTEQDRVCIPVPFYHCFGMVLGNLNCVMHGSTMVIPADFFDPLETLRTVEAERCTALYGVPTMFIAKLEHPQFRDFDLTSLRTGIMAGSSCPIELMRQVTEVMHLYELTIAYGLTEASPVITQTRTDDSLERRVTTVGRLLPHTEVKIVDVKTGRIVPRGSNGELCTRGYLVMQGYYNNPKATAETIDADGWLRTGDLATMDKDGYVRITGRIKEMIIRGGENIYPREIEEFLHTCPAIADVQVVGVPDAKFGEQVMAWIILRKGHELTPEAVKKFCKGEIADFKIPRLVRFVDSFPITISGKVQKFRMREMYVDELNVAVERARVG